MPSTSQTGLLRSSPEVLWRDPTLSGTLLRGPWRLWLLGDGSPTRHLQLLTGHPVTIDLAAMAPDTGSDLHTPREVQELQALLCSELKEGGDEWKAAQHARREVRAMRERAGLSGEQLDANGVSDEEAVEYLKLMHQRLGHTSLRYLRQMHRSGAIWGPEISDSQFNDVQFYCPVCDRTRQTRKPDARKSKRPKKGLKILEAVGVDVIPLKVVSLKTRGPRGRLGGGGNRYAIPFVDMATKRIFMAFTDKKDKLERKVMEAKDAMEMCAESSHEHDGVNPIKVKRFVSDYQLMILLMTLNLIKNM